MQYLAIYGRNTIVKTIQDNTIETMIKDPVKKFSWSEMGYFEYWWSGLKDDKKEEVRKLIEEGRLEILGSGLFSNDEATVYYEDMLDNKFNPQSTNIFRNQIFQKKPVVDLFYYKS